MPEVILNGCTPEPLMSYLKGLGVFRLIAEQADENAMLSWHGNALHLSSRLDESGLVGFFLNDYRPTPIFNPWGGRSGFYPGSSEKSAREALDVILGANNSRFCLYQQTTAGVQQILARLRVHQKNDLEIDDNYHRLLRACRNELPDSVLPWLDAVFVLTETGCKFPPLLGTGGNEGSGSYTSTFAQLVVDLLVRRRFDSAVATSVFAVPGALLADVSVGHFSPGAIGGPNSAQGFVGGGGVNPWDLLLALEGTLLFAGAVARRFGTNLAEKAAFPFTTSTVAVGYGSATPIEETNDGSRAEIWLPIWSKPAKLPEIRQLFSEGRAQLGRRQARNAVEFVLAISLFGASTGVAAFVRYGFLKRNGLSFVATPLGRAPVTPRPTARLLDDSPLTEWLERLRSACRDKERTPARYQSALRNIDRAIFDFCVRSQTDRAADRLALLRVLRALGQAERTLASGLRFCKDNRLHPLAGLNPQWLLEAAPEGDAGREFRLAAALASVVGEKRNPIGPLRIHLEEVEQKRGRVNWQPGSTSAVWTHRGLAGNLSAVLLRRWLESERAGVPGLALRARLFAPVADVIAFLHGLIDDELLEDLLWGLVGLNWNDSKLPSPSSRVRFAMPSPREFGLIRLLLRPVSLVATMGPGEEASWEVVRPTGPAATVTTPSIDPFNQLARGNLPQAVALAARRLWSSGLVPFGWSNRRRRGKYNTDTHCDPERLLAACLFPLSRRALTRLARQVLSPPEHVR